MNFWEFVGIWLVGTLIGARILYLDDEKSPDAALLASLFFWVPLLTGFILVCLWDILISIITAGREGFWKFR